MPSLVFVGTAAGRKRGSVLIDLFSRVVKPIHPEAQMAFVGPAGPEVPGVSYHTGVSDEDLAAFRGHAVREARRGGPMLRMEELHV